MIHICSPIPSRSGRIRRTKIIEVLKERIDIAETKPAGVKKAMYYRKEVFTIMGNLRYPIDKLELIVDSNIWPVPSYGELMF